MDLRKFCVATMYKTPHVGHNLLAVLPELVECYKDAVLRGVMSSTQSSEKGATISTYSAALRLGIFQQTRIVINIITILVCRKILKSTVLQQQFLHLLKSNFAYISLSVF